MASEEQYEDRPREYTEGSPDVDTRVAGSAMGSDAPGAYTGGDATPGSMGGDTPEGYTGAGVPGAVSSSGSRETQRDLAVGGERSTSPAYEIPSEPVPDDQPQADFGNDHATAYDQSRADLDPVDESRRGEFGKRWSGELADTEVAAESFGAAWSNEADVTEVKAQEFGERWAAGPDDSAVRSEEFGAAWSGDNQPDRDPDRDV